MTVEREIQLLKLIRWQFLTLGFYATPWNYDDKNIVYHPISGEPASGIKFDGGRDAIKAQQKAAEIGLGSCAEIESEISRLLAEQATGQKEEA